MDSWVFSRATLVKSPAREPIGGVEVRSTVGPHKGQEVQVIFCWHIFAHSGGKEITRPKFDGYLENSSSFSLFHPPGDFLRFRPFLGGTRLPGIV